ELLVLDEPTNGLDPGEIREIREMIGRLADNGATVLFSSHHLSEVEQVCSHVLVMNHGQLVTHGTVRDLIGAAKSVFVQVDDLPRGRDVLMALPTVSGVQLQTDGLVVELSGGDRADLTAALVGAGLRVETVMATQRLEDAFLDLLATNDTAGDTGLTS
ncbi:MAG: AAA family ATPase, partial [Ilumatobacteraceae bacterium]